MEVYLPHALHDHCTHINQVSQVFTEREGWHIMPTATSSSTGTDVGQLVLLVTVDTKDVYLYILPGTQHEGCVPLEENLVLQSIEIFDVLVGMCQIKPEANSLVQYRTASLSFCPNILKAPKYAYDQRPTQPILCSHLMSGICQHLTR